MAKGKVLLLASNVIDSILLMLHVIIKGQAGQ